MDNPTLYIKSSIAAQQDADYVLRKYLHILRENKNVMVLDVGCGPGNVTSEKVLPLLSKTTKKLLGVDLSTHHIEYARKHYQMDVRLSYEQMDITANTIPLKYIGTFDLVLCLYCLHFVGNYRKALSNIWKLTKPGGNVLLSFILKSSFHDMCHVFFDKPQWKPLMKNFSNCVPPQRRSETCVALMHEIGFEEVQFEIVERDCIHPEEILIGIFTAVNTFGMPEDLRKEFIADQVKYFERNFSAGFDNNNEKLFHLFYTLLIIKARKPNLGCEKDEETFLHIIQNARHLVGSERICLNRKKLHKKT